MPGQGPVKGCGDDLALLGTATALLMLCVRRWRYNKKFRRR